jgi:hypothetical protein
MGRRASIKDVGEPGGKVHKENNDKGQIEG